MYRFRICGNSASKEDESIYDQDNKNMATPQIQSKVLFCLKDITSYSLFQGSDHKTEMIKSLKTKNNDDEKVYIVARLDLVFLWYLQHDLLDKL